MHEHLRACICDIGALQTDMWAKGQAERKKKVKQMLGQRLTHRNSGNHLNVNLFSERESFLKGFLYHAMFTHSD